MKVNEKIKMMNTKVDWVWLINLISEMSLKLQENA